ncbi:MAG: YciI family protein [Acidobacteriota bacterium]
MKYLCICHYETRKYEALTPEDLEELGKECAPHDAALHGSGHLDLVGSLALPSESRTIRPGESGPRVTPGPYAQTPEPFGAFFVIEARDLDEAVAVASNHPGAHLGRFLGGGIEVRPIESFERPGK